MAYNDPRVFQDATGNSFADTPLQGYLNGNFKRALDVVLSLLLLCLTLPVFVVVAAMSKLQGPGRLFEINTFIGLNGVEKSSYSFRTPGSRFGRILRSSGLYALPKLVNVLKGDLSLVGPKPLQIEELDRSHKFSSSYLKVRPGLTGLWFLNREESFSSITQSRRDREYMLSATPFHDLAILLHSTIVFLKRGV